MSDHPVPGEGYWYMAGPYSDSPTKRYRQHLEALAILTKSGLVIYSPIVHCHNMVQAYDMPMSIEFWRNHDFTMIHSSNGVIVLELLDWNQSTGVKEEVLFCIKNDVPIWRLEPPQLEAAEIILKWTRIC